MPIQIFGATKRAALFLAIAAISFGQIDQGQLAGTIKDHTDAVVPQATVTAVNMASGRSVTTKAGENGSYVVTNLLIGLYEVSVEAQGFKKTVQKNIKIDASGRKPGGWLTEQTGRMGDTWIVRQPIVGNALEREKPDNGKDRICNGGGEEGRQHRGVVQAI